MAGLWQTAVNQTHWPVWGDCSIKLVCFSSLRQLIQPGRRCWCHFRFPYFIEPGTHMSPLINFFAGSTLEMSQVLMGLQTEIGAAAWGFNLSAALWLSTQRLTCSTSLNQGGKRDGTKDLRLFTGCPSIGGGGREVIIGLFNVSPALIVNTLSGSVWCFFHWDSQ